jgi:hypothetical protein
MDAVDIMRPEVLGVRECVSAAMRECGDAAIVHALRKRNRFQFTRNRVTVIPRGAKRSRGIHPAGST